MAVLLQSLCIKLGVVTRLDLAQSCRKYYPKYVNIPLYILAELAIIATDLAEVIGSAIALNLLFNLPIVWGVVITAVDVLIILIGFKAKYLRIFENFIILLVYAVAICLLILVGKSNPDWSKIMLGFLPTATTFTNPKKLYVAMGIIGATVMPHNLYLHSSLVKFRSGNGNALGDISELTEDRDQEMSPAASSTALRLALPQTLKFTYLDSAFALTFALIANSSILIVAAAAFYDKNIQEVAELSDAYALLDQYLGRTAAVLFAFALLCSGQSSTITGTLAGQYVMTGFLGESIRVPPWVRRVMTRSLAIIPALSVVLAFGDQGLNRLLVFSQVILSLQLPFAVWPLVHFTSRKDVMSIKLPAEEAAEYPSTASETGLYFCMLMSIFNSLCCDKSLRPLKIKLHFTQRRPSWIKWRIIVIQ